MIRTFYLATATLILSHGAALAADKAVAFDRANLDDPTYVAALYDQIETAARKACKSEMVGHFNRLSAVKHCVQDAVARAVADVDAPLLTSYASDAPAPERVAAR